MSYPPISCYLWKVVTLWRELNLKSRFLNYSGAYANKQCYESNLKILILSIGLCLRSIQPDICNKIAFKQSCIHFEKCRWQKQPKHYSSLNIMTSQHDIRYLLYYRPIKRRHKICSVSLHLVTSKMSPRFFKKSVKLKSFDFTYKSKIFCIL